MYSNHNAHLQTPYSVPHVKKTVVKTGRSAPPSKVASAPKITIKAAKAARKAKEEEEQVVEDDSDDDMGSNFLQFW